MAALPTEAAITLGAQTITAPVEYGTAIREAREPRGITSRSGAGTRAHRARAPTRRGRRPRRSSLTSSRAWTRYTAKGSSSCSCGGSLPTPRLRGRPAAETVHVDGMTNEIAIMPLVAQHGRQTSEVDYAVQIDGRSYSPHAALAFADAIRRTVRDEDERRASLEARLRRGELDDVTLIDTAGAVDEYVAGALARKSARWRTAASGDWLLSDFMPPVIVTDVDNEGVNYRATDGTATGVIPWSLFDRVRVTRPDHA